MWLWLVDGVCDGFADGVGHSGEFFSVMSEGDGTVAGGDGGNNEGTVTQSGGRPSGVSNRDGLMFDASEERDPSCAERDVEFAFGVEVVGDDHGGRPAQQVSMVADVFGGIASAADGWVEDGSFGVEPVAGLSRDVSDSGQVWAEVTADGAGLPEVVVCFDLVGPAELSGR